MVNNKVNLDRVFGALADPTRRAILQRLSQGNETVTELAKPFSSSLPAISKHLSVLEKSGLIVRVNDGRQRICQLTPSGIRSASEWMDFYRRFWSDNLDRLEEYLTSENTEKNDTGD